MLLTKFNKYISNWKETFVNLSRLNDFFVNRVSNFLKCVRPPPGKHNVEFKP